VSSKTATTVVAKVGAGAATGKVEVTTEGGKVEKDGFTLTT
jgi:hypothetical protein